MFVVREPENFSFTGNPMIYEVETAYDSLIFTVVVGSRSEKLTLTSYKIDNYQHHPNLVRIDISDIVFAFIEDKTVIITKGDIIHTVENFAFDCDVYIEENRFVSSAVVKVFRGGISNKAISKLSQLDIEYICPSHGLLWRNKIPGVIKLYSDWGNFIPEEKGVIVAYGSMYGNTEKMAEIVAKELFKCGVKNVRVYDVSKTDSSVIIGEIWKYQGLILGSCAHDGAVYPKMVPLISKLNNFTNKEIFRLVHKPDTTEYGGTTDNRYTARPR